MQNLADRKILVTGATGFIGANLVRALLERGAEVHAMVRPTSSLWRIAEIAPRIRLHYGELGDAEQTQRMVDAIQPEIVFHSAVHRGVALAADRRATLHANVLGTFDLLEATASLKNCRYIQLTSSLEYGTRQRALRESDRLEPIAFYGATRSAATLLCQQYARAQNRSITVLRIFTVYGYWESLERLIPKTILACFRQGEIALTSPGYRHDFVFVEDVVEACLRSLDSPNASGEIINIGSGRQTSNERLVKMIQKLIGARIEIRTEAYAAREWDTSCWVADNRKAAQLLKWKPKHDVELGLKKTIRWFQTHLAEYPQTI